MALSFSNLTAGIDSGLAGTSDSAVTASVTIPANGVAYISVAVAHNETGSPPVVSSVAGASLTWTALATGQTYGYRRSIRAFRAINTGSETSGALTISFTGTNLQEAEWIVDLATGADTSDPDDTPTSSHEDGSLYNYLNLPDVGTPGTGDAVFCAFGFEGATDGFALGSAFTQLGSQTGGTNVRSLKTGYDITATLDETPDAGWDTLGNTCGGVAFIINASSATATVEQEGFRFGDDDASESAHAWLAAQDTNLTAPLSENVLLRVLLNGTDDPASAAYTLRYQKNGSGGYVAVPVGAGITVAPTVEAGDCTESGNNTATTSWAVSYPAYVSGDLLVFHVASDANVTHDWPATGPNGETINTIVDSTGGTAQRASGFWFVGSATTGAGTLTVTPSATEQWTAAVLKVPAGEFNSTTPIQTNVGTANDTGADTSWDTPAWTADATAGGRIVCFAAHDTVTTNAAPTGWTTLVARDRGAVGLTLAARDAANTASESIASANFTNVSSETDSSFGYVINGAVTTNEVYVSPSTNIAAGGEATTARLTAPSGKTTSDFVTGRRWDDENGTDSVDITADNYTEVEWCLQAQSPAENDDYYEFRVYAGTSALDTYTVTPKWTLGTLGEQITPTAGVLALTGYAPSADRTAHQWIVPGAGAVVIAGAAPGIVVTAPVVITPDSGALTISGSAPTVSASADAVLTPDAGALTLTGSAPDVGLTANRWLTPDAGAVVLAGAAPSVTVTQSGVISPDAGSLTLTGYAPVQTLTIPAPAPAVLTLTGYAPTVTVTQSGVISPAAGALTLTGYAPTLAATGNLAITPAAGAITLAGAAPGVAQTAHRWLTPGSGSVVIGGAAPSVSVSDHRSIVPDAGVLTLTGYAPNFAFTSPVIVPANAEIVITGYAPNVIAIRPNKGAGKGGKGRRRVVIRERVYEVSERDIPALIEAELLDRAPPVTAEVVEGPKPPRKRGKKAPQPVKTVEQVREAVQQIKARIEPDNAWLAQALETVAFRVLERLQDEEDSLMLLLAA